ncbi:MAG: 2-oxo acid dehydrogenase subunit E2 [Chloroflexi bacterium]|nr:2-oxo acid dehydrogenase subunit E2 [Chloroflexota bacterium]
MATNILMPSLGFDMTSGVIARWLKKEGDRVAEGEAIAEVDTEKATVEIQSFASGILQKILVQPGETVPVGTVIGIVASPEEAASAPTPAQKAPTAAAVQPTPVPATAGAPAPARAESRDGWTKASPLARRMAKAEGIELGEISGTGPGGRIVQRDVEDYIAQRQVQPPRAPAAPPSAPPAPARLTPPPAPAQLTPAPAPAAPGQQIELSRMRQAIARRMAESKRTVPHFYVTFEINMSEAMRMREQLNKLAPDEDKVSVNDLIVAAAARTIKKWSLFNASYQNDKLQLHNSINIGIAVALEAGLITPVLHDADKKSLKELARESHALVERTRVNRMRAEDVTGGTFSVTNLGMYGAEEFTGIINPPEAAILAVGAVVKRPVVVGDEVQVAQMMKATLSVDHRVADGAQAAQFMQDFKALLENPMNLLLSE